MKRNVNYLRSFEMRVWRRILKIIWGYIVTNKEALRRLDEGRKIFVTISRKAMWVRHTPRRSCVRRTISEGKLM